MAQDCLADILKYFSVICALGTVIVLLIAGGTYVCHFGCNISEDHTRWAEFGNYIGGVGAICNVLVFISITYLIYRGEKLQNTKREKNNIETAIIEKIRILERELARAEAKMRINYDDISNIYYTYLLLYQANYFLRDIRDVSIFNDSQKDEITQVFDFTQEVEKMYSNNYSSFKERNQQYSKEEIIPLVNGINRLIGILNVLEAHIIQQMAHTIKPTTILSDFHAK